MCYEEDILSAYVDGELSSEREVQVKEHLASCGRCRRIVDTYRMLGEFLSQSEETLEPSFARSQERVWERIQARVGAEDRRAPEPFWKKRIQIPVPLVAAAGFLFLGLILFIALQVNNPRDDGIETLISQQQLAKESLIAEESQESAIELEKLVKFLSEQGAAVEVKIELPATSRFQVVGEPQLIRAADYRRDSQK